MTQPTPGQIEAATDAMRAESEIWNAMHERLNRCASRVLSLTITGGSPEGAIFGPFLDMYNGVAETFAARSREGAEQAFSVALALYSVAEGYDNAEAGNLHRLRGLTAGGAHDPAQGR